MTISTINPATGNVIKTYDDMSAADVKKIIEQSHHAFLSWSKTSFAERAEHMQQVSRILLDDKKNFADLISTEMGKLKTSAEQEIEKCALTCRHFAEHAETYLAKRDIKTELTKSYVMYAPLGVVFAVMPWNFPFWQVIRFAAPALMAGNAAILKHAPITTGCGLAIEKIFKEAGFPDNLFRTVIVNNDIAADIIQDSRISAVTLTGSDKTGKIVAANAAGSLKKIVLELGGSDPYLILEDANLEKAADAVIASRLNNSGQSCIAAKRILAVQPIRDNFQKIILEKLAKAPAIAPLARADLRDNLHKQVQESIQKGATLLMGGELPKSPGFFYPITALANIKKGMPAYDDELFGPVFSFIDVKDEKEAIAIANDTRYGLSAAVFTEDLQRGERIATQEIKTGTVFVNEFVRSDPRLPFGGIKHSGFGRELSQEGIREFVDVKTIGIK